MAIYLIVLLCVLNHLCFNGGRVVVSLYALHLGADAFTVGTLMALYALLPLVLGVYAGRLADRIGARMPMMLGSLGVAAATALPAVLPGTATLYVTTLLLGTSFHFFFVAVHGITGGVGGPENRARNYALVSLGFSAASFSGPMIAGFSIDYLGHINAFIVLAVFPLAPFLLLLFKPGFLPPAAGPGKNDGRRALDLWRIPKLRGAFIASGILSAAWDLFQFYFPIYGHSIGLSASMIGIVIGIFAAATFTVRVFLPYIAKRYSEAEILAMGIFVAAFAFTLFPFFSNAWALAGVAFILGLGVGSGQPMSMSLIYALAPKGRASEAAGLRVTVNNIAHLFIPLFFGTVGAAFGFTPVWLTNAALLVGGGVFMQRKYKS